MPTDLLTLLQTAGPAGWVLVGLQILGVPTLLGLALLTLARYRVPAAAWLLTAVLAWCVGAAGTWWNLTETRHALAWSGFVGLGFGAAGLTVAIGNLLLGLLLTTALTLGAATLAAPTLALSAPEQDGSWPRFWRILLAGWGGLAAMALAGTWWAESNQALWGPGIAAVAVLAIATAAGRDVGPVAPERAHERDPDPGPRLRAGRGTVALLGTLATLCTALVLFSAWDHRVAATVSMASAESKQVLLAAFAGDLMRAAWTALAASGWVASMGAWAHGPPEWPPSRRTRIELAALVLVLATAAAATWPVHQERTALVDSIRALGDPGLPEALTMGVPRALQRDGRPGYARELPLQGCVVLLDDGVVRARAHPKADTPDRFARLRLEDGTEAQPCPETTRILDEAPLYPQETVLIVAPADLPVRRLAAHPWFPEPGALLVVVENTRRPPPRRIPIPVSPLGAVRVEWTPGQGLDDDRALQAFVSECLTRSARGAPCPLGAR